MLLSVGIGFQLSPFDVYRNPKVFRFCDGIDSKLEQAVREVSKSFPVHIMFDSNQSSGTICNVQTDQYYAKTVTFSTMRTDIYVSTYLVTNYHNTLKNVIQHELGHSIGLSHSTERGLMNYSVQTSFFGRVYEDSRVLWPSIDDHNAIASLH